MRFISNAFANKKDTEYLNPRKEEDMLGMAVQIESTVAKSPAPEEKPVCCGALLQAFKKEDIRELAYLKWEAAGCPDGQETAEQFWLEAEKELQAT